jgi:deoxyribonucleoside regulator
MILADGNSLIEIARLYYREDLSQQEIADRLGISRPTVSHALKRCRQRGIVEIRIREPDSLARSLAGELERRHGLKKVLVVESGADDAERKRNLGRAAAGYLAGLLADGCRIGVSWGTTLYQVAQHLPMRPLQNVQVVQLIGALGSVQPRFDGFELARHFAERVGGTYGVIQAPALVRSAALKRLLLKEPAILQALRRAASADLAVIGISSDRPELSALVRAGFLSKKEALALCRKGAVGHACGWHVDLRGRVLRTPAHDRLVGIAVDELKRIPTVIGVAGGPEKADAILGTLRAGLLDALVTDDAVARRLAAEAGNQEKTDSRVS